MSEFTFTEAPPGEQKTQPREEPAGSQPPGGRGGVPRVGLDPALHKQLGGGRSPSGGWSVPIWATEPVSTRTHPENAQRGVLGCCTALCTPLGVTVEVSP